MILINKYLQRGHSYEYLKRTLVHLGFELNSLFRFGAGALAGIVAVTSTYPLDIVRTRLSIASATFSRLEAQNGSGSRPASSAARSLHAATGRSLATVAATSMSRREPLGVFGMAMKVMREEGGIRALYRGLVPTALGVVCSPIDFQSVIRFINVIPGPVQRLQFCSVRRLETHYLPTRKSHSLQEVAYRSTGGYHFTIINLPAGLFEKKKPIGKRKRVSKGAMLLRNLD